MREYYIDEKGQKRRLRFDVGDIILSRVDGVMNAYQVTVDQMNPNLFGLDCLMCTKPIASPTFTKRHLQKIIYTFDIYKVVKKEELVQFLLDRCGDTPLHVCRGQRSNQPRSIRIARIKG